MEHSIQISYSKEMKKKLLVPALMMFAIAVTSCNKDQGEGGKVSYRIKPVNSSATLIGAAKDGNTISGASTVSFTSGSMIISEIDFEAENKNVEIEYESKQVVTVDLFNLSPILGSISIPDGTYEEVELKLDLRKTTTGAVPLFLKGEYTDASGAKSPVEFSFNDNVEIEVEAENVVINSVDYIGMINLQLSKFLTNVTVSDLSQVTKLNGKIVISSTSNTALYNKIKSNLNSVADCDFED